jgi:hypothetical protein
MWQRVGALSPSLGMDVTLTPSTREPSSDQEQKQAALHHLHEAWAEARLDGVDDDAMAMACLFAGLAQLVTTYGEDAAARYTENLPKRLRNGEFTLDRVRQ